MKNKSFCIGNWKAYLDYNESISFINNFLKYEFANDTNTDIIICPDYISLFKVQSMINSSDVIQIGSQDISRFDKGAFTGEISITNLQNINCEWSIVGHSERRSLFNEHETIICDKFLKIFNSKFIKPILCIGETLEQKQAGKTNTVLINQISSVFDKCNFNNNKDILLAYEPVWSIGTGVTADLFTIEQNIDIMKNFIKKYDTKNCNIYMLYGGSVNEKNATDIFKIQDVSGFLIGSSSILPDSFYSIYKSLIRSN